MAVTMTELARVLGLSKGQVSKLAQRGMPLDDAAAAAAWRTEHLHPAWTKRKALAQPQGGPPSLDPMVAANNVLCAVLSRSTAWGIFTPAAASALLEEAGIQGVTADRARRFASLLLVTWANCAIELVDGDELLFMVPAWADPDAAT